jgi:hypothetical protein
MTIDQFAAAVPPTGLLDKAHMLALFTYLSEKDKQKGGDSMELKTPWNWFVCSALLCFALLCFVLFHVVFVILSFSLPPSSPPLLSVLPVLTTTQQTKTNAPCATLFVLRLERRRA